METATNGALAEHKDAYQYVPLLKSLHALLQNAEICDEVGAR